MDPHASHSVNVVLKHTLDLLLRMKKCLLLRTCFHLNTFSVQSWVPAFSILFKTYTHCSFWLFQNSRPEQRLSLLKKESLKLTTPPQSNNYLYYSLPILIPIILAIAMVYPSGKFTLQRVKAPIKHFLKTCYVSMVCKPLRKEMKDIIIQVISANCAGKGDRFKVMRPRVLKVLLSNKYKRLTENVSAGRVLLQALAWGSRSSGPQDWLSVESLPS